VSEPFRGMGTIEQLHERLARLEAQNATLIELIQELKEEEVLYSIRTVMKKFDVSKSTVEKWLREKKLEQVKLGKSLRMRSTEINAVIRGEKVIEP
jgi:excisionase family DNA binding protein